MRDTFILHTAYAEKFKKYTCAFISNGKNN